MLIACLHDTARDIPIYEAACPRDVVLAHHVRSDLLYRAKREANAATVFDEARAHLRRLAAGSEAVLLTSVVLWAAAEDAAYAAVKLLAEAIDTAGAGNRVEVLYTNPAAATHLTRAFGCLSGPASIAVAPVDGAWDALVNGRQDRHDRLVADAARDSRADIMALAQATMSPAVAPAPAVLRIADAALAGLMRHLSAGHTRARPPLPLDGLRRRAR